MGCCVESSHPEDVGSKGIQQRAVGADMSNNEIDQLSFNDGLSQRLMLTISCETLPNLDKKSRTDPFCVIWQMKGSQKAFIGQTECILDSMNPEFVTSIDVEYRFEENQKFIIEVYDADDMNQLNNL